MLCIFLKKHTYRQNLEGYTARHMITDLFCILIGAFSSIFHFFFEEQIYFV